MPTSGRTVTDNFAQVPLATGVLVIVPGIPVSVGLDKVNCKVIGNDTGTIYVNEWSDYNTGMQLVCSNALNLESSFDVEVVYPGPPSAPTVCAYVWALFGPNVVAPFTAREQPLFVAPTRGIGTFNSRGQVFSQSTSTSGDQSLGTLGINSAGSRYLRRLDIAAAWSTAVSVSGWAVYLKGVTSATTLQIYNGVVQTATAGASSPSLNYDNHPLDLVDLFPSDASLQVHAVIPAGMAIGVNMLVTP